MRIKDRDRVEIITLILDVANQGNDTTKLTKIMRETILTHPQLKEYWTVLTDNGFLNHDKDTETFKTTEKGVRFLETYKKAKKGITMSTKEEWQLSIC